uniref:G-protein coupled receptors family 1 profile domain-containing protein n=1 Tax=Oncorhynchus tshawytscha TaxID=74940 RepID=A0AAZ3QRJ7_ONCTS
MSVRNHSFVTEFFYGLASTVLFLVYCCILIGNVVVIILFATHNVLHKPMYFIILNLVVSDVLFSTTTLPKIIARYCLLLLIMALDRYVSICFPLRYPMIINNSTIHILQCHCVGACTPSLSSMVIRFSCFCFSNGGITGTSCFIIFSYCSIIVAVVQIASSQGRLKTLSTCSGQLIIIALYFLPRCFIYLASNIGIRFSTDLRIVVIMLYSLTDEIKQIMIKRFRRIQVDNSI